MSDLEETIKFYYLDKNPYDPGLGSVVHIGEYDEVSSCYVGHEKIAEKYGESVGWIKYQMKEGHIPSDKVESNIICIQSSADTNPLLLIRKGLKDGSIAKGCRKASCISTFSDTWIKKNPEIFEPIQFGGVSYYRVDLLENLKLDRSKSSK